MTDLTFGFFKASSHRPETVVPERLSARPLGTWEIESSPSCLMGPCLRTPCNQQLCLDNPGDNVSASLQVADDDHVSDAMHTRRQAGRIFFFFGVMRDAALSEWVPQ